MAMLAAGCSSSATPPAPPPPASSAMYVTDFANQAVLVYSQNANCNCAPRRFLQGGNTGLAGPAGVAVDAAGAIYVTNEAVNTLRVYPPGASGNAPSILTITGLFSPVGVAVDGAGNVYVVNSASSGGIPSIAVYAPGRTVPSTTISGTATGLSEPAYIALDGSDNIWVTDTVGNRVEEFLAGSSGNVAPNIIIAGGSTGLSSPEGIAFGPNGYLYVAVVNPPGVPDAVLIFQTPSAPGTYNQAPLNELCGPNTLVNNPAGIAVNSLGTLFVVNAQSSLGSGYITTFSAGNIGGGPSCVAGPVPNAVIGGNNTPFADPLGIALH